VRDFHHDLTDAVQSQASPLSGLGPGLFDQEIPPGADPKASLTAALSTAEVFVPLYSPGYLARSWPAREWACFQQRLVKAEVADPLSRYAPVLWTPLPWEVDPPGLREAMDGADREYAENGLRTLLRLQLYRPSYERVVGQIAARIVDLAENFPVGPSAAPDIDRVPVPGEFQTEASGAYFAVTVAAPTISDLAAGRDRSGYGASRADWRPYPGDQELPLAQHAAQIAEQMDLAVLTTSIEKLGDQQTARPGVILIDPWFVATEAGHAMLESYVRDLPRWVLPLLILDPSPDSRSLQLADLVRNLLGAKPRARVDVAERAVRGVSSLADFAVVMPVLAAEAERQYLRHGPVPHLAPGAARPRLTDGPSAPPPRPESAPDDRERETPDA
jgi:FxsC-like protein